MRKRDILVEFILTLINQRPLTSQEKKFYYPVPEGLHVSDIADEIIRRIKGETLYVNARLVESKNPQMLEVQLV